MGGTRHLIEEICGHQFISPPMPPLKDILHYEKDEKDQYWRPDRNIAWIKQLAKQKFGDKVVKDLKSATNTSDKIAIREQALEDTLKIPQVLEYYNRINEYRKDGLWFMNNGTPTYITGHNYFYCNWYVEATDKNKDPYRSHFGYRNYNRQIFSVFDIAEKDPNSLGIILAAARRTGKTSIMCSTILNIVTLNKGYNGGIQSTQEKLAGQIFSKSVKGFKNMPFFWKPPYTGPDTPDRELDFSIAGGRGLDGMDMFGEKEANKFEHGGILDYRSSSVTAYDGLKLHALAIDEWGKTEEVDVNERHGVLMKTMNENGVNIGKMIAGSTVEDVGKGQALINAKMFWDDCRLRDIDLGNGKIVKSSPNKLLQVFISYEQTLFMDKYGNPNLTKARESIKLQRAEGLASNDPKRYAAIVRQTATNIDEVFEVQDVENGFDSAILLARKRELESLGKPLYVDYSLHWNDERTEVFMKPELPIVLPNGQVTPNPNAAFHFAWIPEQGVLNRVETVGYKNTHDGRIPNWVPLNAWRFGSATDPVAVDNPKYMDKASKACILVAPKLDMVPNEFQKGWPGGVPFVLYNRRTSKLDEYHEDCIKLVHLLGCGIQVENNRDGGLITKMQQRGYGKFLSFGPETDENKVGKAYKSMQNHTLRVGINASATLKRTCAQLMKLYIERTGHLIPFIELIDQLMKYDINETRKFDVAITYGYLCLEVESLLNAPKKGINLQNQKRVQSTKPAF